jgi:hypothetical protein
MSHCESYDVAITTAADGSATARTGKSVNGRVLEVRYDRGDIATGADFTITGNTSGKAVLTITNGGTADISWQPRQVIHPVANTGAGSALTYDGTNEIYEPIWLSDEEIKVVVAQGGNATSGTLTFIVG